MSQRRSPTVRQVVANVACKRAGVDESANPPGTELRILVVEDEPIIAELLSDVLEGMGYGVCGIATSQIDAISAAERCRPDLMIVDVRLGKGSGLCAVEEILRGRHVPHVFVSADLSAVRAQRPASVALQKPYCESDLARAIQRALAQPVVS